MVLAAPVRSTHFVRSVLRKCVCFIQSGSRATRPTMHTQAADGEGLQTWSAPVNIMKQLLRDKAVWSSSSKAKKVSMDPCREGLARTDMLHKASKYERLFGTA
jgi:hypothetical protein